MHRQPRDLIFKRPGEARVVARPRDRRDHHPVTLAIHARRPRLQKAVARAKIHRPPPPTTITLIVARTAPPAMSTTITLPGPRAQRHHQRPVIVELDVLDHHSTQPEQLLPYPKWAHAATVPFTSVTTVRSRNRKTRGVRTTCPVVGRLCRPDLTAPKRSQPAGSSAANPLQTTTSAVRRPPTTKAALDAWPAGELPRHGPHLTHGTCRGASFWACSADQAGGWGFITVAPNGELPASAPGAWPSPRLR